MRSPGLPLTTKPQYRATSLPALGFRVVPPPYLVCRSDLVSVWESGVVGMAHGPLHSDGLGGVVTGALGVSTSDGDMRVDRWFVRWMTACTPWTVSRPETGNDQGGMQ